MEPESVAYQTDPKMKNKKGFEMTISTLILLVLGVVILIALIIALTGGLDRFRSASQPFLNTAEGVAVKASCQDACDTENKFLYCCQEYEIADEEMKCQDARLEIECDLTCEPSFCDANTNS